METERVTGQTHTHTHYKHLTSVRDFQSGQARPTYVVHRGDPQSAPRRFGQVRITTRMRWYLKIWRFTGQPSDQSLRDLVSQSNWKDAAGRRSRGSLRIRSEISRWRLISGRWGKVSWGFGFKNRKEVQFPLLFFSFFTADGMKESQLLRWSLLEGSDLRCCFNIIQVSRGLLKVEGELSRFRLQWE